MTILKILLSAALVFGSSSVFGQDQEDDGSYLQCGDPYGYGPDTGFSVYRREKDWMPGEDVAWFASYTVFQSYPQWPDYYSSTTTFCRLESLKLEGKNKIILSGQYGNPAYPCSVTVIVGKGKAFSARFDDSPLVKKRCVAEKSFKRLIRDFGH